MSRRWFRASVGLGQRGRGDGLDIGEQIWPDDVGDLHQRARRERGPVDEIIVDPPRASLGLPSWATNPDSDADLT